MARVAKQAIIRGRVQGVWFRAWTVETAGRLGLNGWVRNRTDGSVELIAEGVLPAVEALLEALWEGPTAARVDSVEIRETPLLNRSGFEKRATI